MQTSQSTVASGLQVAAICIQLIREQRNPSLLHRWGQKIQGKQVQDSLFIQAFSYMFVFESLSFILKPFSFRSNLQREPLGLSRAFMKVISFWNPSNPSARQWLALSHTPADSCREGCATTRTLLVHLQASLGNIIFLPDAFLSCNFRFKIKH